MEHSKLLKFYRGTARHFWTTVFSFMLIGIYALIGLHLTFVNPFVEALKDFRMTDICYKMMAEEESHAITIVDLTDLYSRTDIAQTLHEIESMNPRVIGLDCVFEGLKDDTIGNEMLIDVASTYDNIVYSCKVKEETIGGERQIRSFFADSVAIPEGVTNMPRSLYGGVKRKLEHKWNCNGEKLTSMVDGVMKIYGDETERTGATNINFQPTHFNVIQPYEVLSSRDLIEGRIVFFGAMADEVDMHYTPLGKMPGVELLAYATQTLIEQKAIWRLPWLLQLLLTVSLVILTEYLLTLYKYWTLHHKNPIIRHFVGSTYVISLWQFLWIALLMYGVIICFTQWYLDIDIGGAASAIAMLSMGRSLRDAFEGYLREKKEKRNASCSDSSNSRA